MSMDNTQNMDQPDESHLPPTKVKRKYICKQCNFLTFNPREHLRHRRDVHHEKVRIVPCFQCQYACQFRQKLNRHLNLMHYKIPNKRVSRRSKKASSSVNNHQLGADQFNTQNNLNQNYRNWLQLQEYLATNQQHPMANSFYYQNYPNQLPVNDGPLDLSLPKQ